MISSAPLTRNINQGGGGYNYNSTTVLGFPQIHNWMISGLSLMPVKDEVDVCGGIRLGVLLSPMRVRSFNPAIIVYFGFLQDMGGTDRYGSSGALSSYVCGRWFGEGFGELGRSYRYFYFVECSCD